MVKSKKRKKEKMISATYDKENKCVYLKSESGEYIGTLYDVLSAEVKKVGASGKVTFKDGGDIPLLVIFCEYSELK